MMWPQMTEKQSQEWKKKATKYVKCVSFAPAMYLKIAPTIASTLPLHLDLFDRWLKLWDLTYTSIAYLLLKLKEDNRTTLKDD